ncbi:MAG: hypothetical protein SGPRY_010281, partial [Prymnesium sp.]
QKKGGTDLEDDDEEEAERVKVSQKSPFVPVKVNKAKERQQIIEWARKRQGHTRTATSAEVSKVEHASRRTEASLASGGTPLRSSASAPLTLRKPPPSQLPFISAQGHPDSPQASGEGAARYTAQHGAAPPQVEGRGGLDPTKVGRRTRTPTEPSEEEGGGGEGPSADHSRSAPALQGDSPRSLPRIPSAEAARPTRKGKEGREGKGKEGKGKANSASRSSAPAMRSGASSNASGPPPKDLGTMIYLLGTQSSSMNARRLAHAAGPS